MDLQALLQVVRERWMLIGVTVVLAGALATVMVVREAPRYAAQSTLYVSAHVEQDNAVSAYQGSLLTQQQVRSYAELVRSSRVLDGVRRSLGLTQTARQLAGRISATVVPETALLTISAVDASPQGAQRLANAVADSFMGLLPTLEGSNTANSPIMVSMVSEASLPSAPFAPRPVRTIAFAVMLGVLAGVVLAAVRHTLDNTVKTVEQAEEITDTPVLGAVPDDSSTRRQPVAIDQGHRSQRAEALRKITTSLRFMDVERRHSVMLVTSPAAGDGKSVTACNLAHTLALSGRNVILVDADLRRPQVGTYLGLPSGVGLTNVLVGSATLAEAIQSWADNTFAVLASGLIPPNPTEMLGSRRMRELIAYLRGEYDDVVIDVPPVLPVADAAVAATVADGVIMVTRHGKTRRDQLKQAANTMRATETPLLGVVLNRKPARDSSDYYYYRSRPVSSPETLVVR